MVTGHSTKSIAVYATRLSQVRNDNNTKTHIPWHIHIGYGDLETGEGALYQYIEGGNKNMESFAVFIHKNALTEGFVFPEHEFTPWCLIHRPKEEVCIWVWHDVENDEWEILDLEERLEDTELNTEQVMTIMEELHDRYFKPIEFDGELAPSSWPFPTGDKK